MIEKIKISSISKDSMNLMLSTKKGLLFKTKTGYIGEKDFYPQNMINVTGIVLVGSFGGTHIPIQDIRDIDIKVLDMDGIIANGPFSRYGINGICDINIKTPGKDYKINGVFNSISHVEFADIIRNENYDNYEKMRELYQESCLHALNGYIGHLQTNTVDAFKIMMSDDGYMDADYEEDEIEDPSYGNIICPICGELLKDDYVFCGNCGCKVTFNMPTLVGDHEKRIEESYVAVPNDIDFFESIKKCGFMNDISFPYWVYRIDTLEVNGDIYKKLYLFNRKWDDKELCSITIVNDFESLHRNVIKYNNRDNLYTCVIKANEINRIEDMTIENTIIKSSNQICNFNTDSINEYSLDDVVSNGQYKQAISKLIWRCSCGRINNIEENACLCGNYRIDIGNDNSNNYSPNDIIEHYIEKGVSYNTGISFDENISSFFNEFEKLYPDISIEQLKSKIDIFKEKDIYDNLVKNEVNV